MAGDVVIDGRNVARPRRRSRAAGLDYEGIGVG